MRAANNGDGPSGRTGGVREAIEALSIERVQTLATNLETYDVLEAPGVTADRWERFRRHGVAVRVGTERIGELARLPQRDELAVSALLHDVGKLVIAQLYGETTRSPPRAARPPRTACATSAASSGSTTHWSAPSSSAAGGSRR